MIKEIMATAVLSGTAYAGLPLAHEYNPAKHSGEYVAEVSNGSAKAKVEVKVFGQEDVMSARLAGRSLTLQYPRHSSAEDMQSSMTEKAQRRYGSDQYMIDRFVNEARVSYILRMRELNQQHGLSIQ